MMKLSVGLPVASCRNNEFSQTCNRVEGASFQGARGGGRKSQHAARPRTFSSASPAACKRGGRADKQCGVCDHHALMLGKTERMVLLK